MVYSEKGEMSKFIDEPGVTSFARALINSTKTINGQSIWGPGNINTSAGEGMIDYKPTIRPLVCGFDTHSNLITTNEISTYINDTQGLGGGILDNCQAILNHLYGVSMDELIYRLVHGEHLRLTGMVLGPDLDPDSAYSLLDFDMYLKPGYYSKIVGTGVSQFDFSLEGHALSEKFGATGEITDFWLIINGRYSMGLGVSAGQGTGTEYEEDTVAIFGTQYFHPSVWSEHGM